MGLFSSETKTYVSSSVYNLAGDEDLNSNVLSEIVLGSVLSDRTESLGSQIARSLRSSTALQQKRFFRWAQKNYDLGMPDAVLDADQRVSTSLVYEGLLKTLTIDTNQTLQALSAQIDDAHLDYWAEAWINSNRPDLGYDAWDVHWVVDQGIVITTLDPSTGETTVLTTIPTPDDFVWGMDGDRKLLYIAYRLLTETYETAPDGSEIRRIATGPTTLYTYRMGTGTTAFDKLAAPKSELSEFYPAIPLRLNNKSIRHSKFESQYEAATKAFKKLTGGNIDKMLDDIEANESIDDIDFCFLVPGVPLNTESNVGKEYLYAFFRQFVPMQTVTTVQQSAASEIEQKKSKSEWEYAVTHVTDTFPISPLRPLTSGTRNQIRVSMSKLKKFDMRIRWTNIVETHHVGNCKAFDGNTTRGTAKVGDYWFATGNPIVTRRESHKEEANSFREFTLYRDTSRFFMFHQYGKRRYRRLEIQGFEHRNRVYDGESVKLSAKKAMGEDDDSGFLVPLHYPTLRNLSALDRFQFAKSSTYLVFNSYEQVKTKWYQKGIFKVILVIAAVAFSIYTAGASLGATVGLLGTNAAVGAALGATAASAAIVGAVANAVAAIVLTTIITKGATKLFGEKWGTIIGTIVSFVAMTYGTQFAATGNFNVDWGSLMRVENLMKVTDSVGDAYSRWLHADTLEIQEEMGELAEKHDDKLKEIEQLSKEILGMTDDSTKAMLLTEASEHFGESSEAFLGRTLMTGSDIAQLSHALIESFVDISLELPRAHS